MKNSTIIIIAIIAVAVIAVAAYAAMNMTTTAQQQNSVNNTITQNGSKITIYNQNTQYYAHLDLVMYNLTLKNGTKQDFFIEAWMKPGGNVTIDLSNMLGYGNERLPTDTNITMLTWGGLYSNGTTGTSNFNFDTTFTGWTTAPILQTYNNGNITYWRNFVDSYNITISGSAPIGPLPSFDTNNIAYIKLTQPEARDDPLFDNDEYEQLFTIIQIIIDPNGVPHFNASVTPELCALIAGNNHII